MIEPYREPELPLPATAAILLAALVLFVGCQQLAFRLREEERRTWWASNGRDLVNALAAVALSFSVWLVGIALPLSIILGCTLTLALTLIGTFLHERMERPWRLMLAVAVVFGAPFVVAPSALANGVADLVASIFPG
ncbi:MAG TPA: hypothetical protein VGD74_03530 [Vulgatibacter sp.]